MACLSARALSIGKHAQTVLCPRRVVPSHRAFSTSPALAAGHSHWANIKRAKAVNDAQRANAFNRVSKQITSAVRQAGKDLSTNLKLVAALSAAREVNFPKDKVEAAIAKGVSNDASGNLEEVLYEGFGPHGVAVLVQALTPNRNRSGNTIRHCFDKYGGALGGSGNVAWIFQQKGQLVVDRNGKSEDEIMELAVELNAEDYEIGSGENANDVVFWCARADLISLKNELENRKFAVRSMQLTYLPSSTADITAEQQEEVEKLVDGLSENEDVQQVFHNASLASS